MTRAERALRDAQVLEDAHKRIAAINEMDEHDDILAHIGRRVRVMRETARRAARAGGR